jgi:competence protein CoiA
MLWALYEGSLSLAYPKQVGECPTCAHEVIAKCGSKVVWHWAHRSRKDCDSWSEPESVWHAAWKSRFEKTEVTFANEDKAHRADAVTPCGVVLEFQHSAISSEEISERESFYGNMVWVVDATQAFEAKRIGLDMITPNYSGWEYVKFHWKRRRTSFDDARRPVFLDLGFGFSDLEKPFYKPSAWWDDGDDGLRDGIRREGQMTWQRVTHDLFLLEVKKQHASGYGWGKLVSHKEFCRRFGAVGFLDYYTRQSLRWVPQAWPGWSGYTHLGDFQMGRFPSLEEYAWCEEQVERSRRIKEAV